MTTISYPNPVSNLFFIESYIHKKIDFLKQNHPSIQNSKVEIILDDNPTDKLCKIKLHTEWSNFVVSSNAIELKSAVDECTIILNYQLAVMLKI